MIKLISTIEELLTTQKDVVIKLFNDLNLDYQGFEKIKDALTGNNYNEACQELLNYYKTSRDIEWGQYGSILDDRVHTEEELNDLFSGFVTFQEVRDQVFKKPDKKIDWTHTGPHNDKEYCYFLNRHHFLKMLADAYSKKKDPKYVRLFNMIIQDWIISNPTPKTYIKSSQWRGLEVALRMTTSWINSFFLLKNTDEFTPASKILTIASINEHAKYNFDHPPKNSNNIKVMILNSISTVGVIFPEFKNSQKWINYAKDGLIHELTTVQVYPSGIQTELTNHYHYVAMKNFQHFKEMMDKAEIELPQEFINRLIKMWNYYAYNMRPNGYGLLNNDSDLDYVKSRVLDASKIYNRMDWKYIATNGAEGTAPKEMTILFPFAGQFIMRNGWSIKSHWAFFDIGPLGTGHVHRDKLHISISINGRDILVDSGRFHYIGDNMRKYFTGTESHNTVLINNHGQKNFERKLEKPIKSKHYIINNIFDFAIGQYDSGYKSVIGNIIHRRAVVYIKNRFWLVVDQITSKKKRKIDTLWHFHPQCNVEIVENIIKTNDKDLPNLLIDPLDDQRWNLSLIKGQIKPFIQGWWSEHYNQKVPSYCGIYSSKNKGSIINPWLIIPYLNQNPTYKTEIILENQNHIGIRIEYQNKTIEIFIRFEGNTPFIVDGKELDTKDRSCIVFIDKKLIK